MFSVATFSGFSTVATSAWRYRRLGVQHLVKSKFQLRLPLRTSIFLRYRVSENEEENKDSFNGYFI